MQRLTLPYRPVPPGAGHFVFLALFIAGALAGPAPLRAQSAATLHGRVLDARGLPVAGALVRVEPAGGRTSTDPDGRWTLGGLPPGPARVVVSTAAVVVSRNVEVPREGESARLDVELPTDAGWLPEVTTLVEADRPAGDRRVLARSDLQRAGSLAAALERVPGVFVRSHGSGGARHVSIRGADPEGTLVLWGEERLLAPGGGAVDLSTIPPTALDSVEVLPRGASSRWGEGAAGGVVRLHPASGAVRRGGGLEARVGIGSLGERRAAGAVRLPVAGGGLALTAETRGWEEGYARELNADGTELGLAGAFDLAGGGLGASAALHRSDRGAPGPVFAPTPAARLDGERVLASVRGAWLTGGWSGRAEGTWQSVGLEYVDADRAASRLDSRESAVALRGTASRDVGGHAVETGLELRRREARSSDLAGRPVRWEVGGWTAARWSASRLSLSPSVRLDGVILEGTGGDRLDTFLSPGLSAALDLGSGLALTAYAGRSYRYPSFESLFFLSGVAVRANPDLREERSRDLEAGLAWDGPAGLSLAASVFDRVLTGAIVWLPDFRFVWSPRNLPRAVVRGGEVRGAWRAPGGLELLASWTHAPARFDFPGNDHPLPYRPAHLGQAEVALLRGAVRAAAQLRYTGRRHPNVAGTNALGSYVLADVSAAWTRPLAGGDVALEMRVENALDRAYEVVFGFPAARRTVHLGARWRTP